MAEMERNEKTIMVFSGDLDKVMAAFNIAIGALSLGFKVNMFFTFWGINAVKKESLKVPRKDLFGTMFDLMMPRGPSRLVLSKLNFLGVGTWMMKKRMVHKNITLLPELIKLAQDMGASFVACDMTKDMMGIEDEEIIDGVEFGGGIRYVELAEHSNYNIFV